ncbi:ribonuclease H family protein [Oceanobacillus senegalensis]|uniref:ribonuclease H family protein n=1 Tax=Oceanobacillus senegalensis TaxID=1936063 RepID=UPI000A3082E7|nr:ribonuclease H family protein [Oceanobacillus senegalensis]
MKVKMELTYRTPSGVEAIFYTDEMRVEKALMLMDDIEKKGRLKNVIFIDSQEHIWTLKELKKWEESIQTETHHVTVCFDGGFNESSKKSGLGCAIYYEQNGKRYRLRKNALVEELDTNNEAEYAALHLGLQELEYLGVHHLDVTFIGDSQVVINQLSGEWPCYEKELSKWADRIDAKLEQLGIRPEYQAISRKKNREADHLASQALSGIEIMSTIEITS